ncbi:MAG: uracil-DNA glycosylase family protein [Cyclobacteriaceae bacterium]
MTFAENVLKFYSDLRIRDPLPDGIGVLNPYQDAATFEVCRNFYGKFYNDNLKRFLILGINPGRYGAGITGVPFTDPVKLEAIFGIETSFLKKRELSADFIHAMIDAFGGAEKFFSKFFINSVSPLGFIQSGKNLNYYDTPALKKAVEPFIRESIKHLVGLNIDRSVAFCLGEGENYKYLQKLNEEQRFFHRIIPLAHPRFIMQYKRKHLAHYVKDYVQKLNL